MVIALAERCRLACVFRVLQMTTGGHALFVDAMPYSRVKELTMKTVVLASLMSASAFVFVGCNSGTNPPGDQHPAQTAQSPVTSPISINAEMVAVVDHAAHELWNVEQEGHKPSTPADWEGLAEHATQLAASGALIMIPGTGANDNTFTQQAKWQKWSKDLSDVGLAELKASQANNVDAVIAANNRLVEVCEGCHKDFKPTLPSEGIAHKHMHAASK